MHGCLTVEQKAGSAWDFNSLCSMHHQYWEVHGSIWEYVGVYDSAWVLDSGTVGSECMGFLPFVYSAPIMGSGWESMGEHGSTWKYMEVYLSTVEQKGEYVPLILCAFSVDIGEWMEVHASAWKFMGFLPFVYSATIMGSAWEYMGVRGISTLYVVLCTSHHQCKEWLVRFPNPLDSRSGLGERTPKKEVF